MDMNLGGPVWHASVAGSLIKAVLWQEAERQLAVVGDASLGEWREVGDRAVHLRRRLSEREQRHVGPVVDIRRSDEARTRAARLGGLLALAPPEVLAEEVGEMP
jgi:hypothetical protein